MLDLTAAPTDPVERVVWLDELQSSIANEFLTAFQVAYFEARLTGRLEVAMEVAPHGRKQIMAMTRHENERRGRMIRWNGMTRLPPKRGRAIFTVNI